MTLRLVHDCPTLRATAATPTPALKGEPAFIAALRIWFAAGFLASAVLAVALPIALLVWGFAFLIGFFSASP